MFLYIFRPDRFGGGERKRKEKTKQRKKKIKGEGWLEKVLGLGVSVCQFLTVVSPGVPYVYRKKKKIIKKK